MTPDWVPVVNALANLATAALLAWTTKELRASKKERVRMERYRTGPHVRQGFDD